MKKRVYLLLLTAMIAFSLSACKKDDISQNIKTFEGKAEGFNGEVTVVVKKDGEKITEVLAEGKEETEGIGTMAIEQLPKTIVEKNSTDVEVVSGATITSNAIIYAVNNALDPEKYPYPIVEEESKDEEEEQVIGEAGSIAKIGLGHNISIDKSKDASEGQNAEAQAVVTVVAAGFDEEGKIASVKIDVAQTFVEFDENMKVTTDKTKEIKSKKELGNDYGMLKASSIKKEWFEQIEYLENWMIGKTVDEIKSLKLKDGVTDDADLISSVTIAINDYISALDEAWENSIALAKAEKLGLSLETNINSSKDKDGDVLPVAQMDTYIGVTALDSDDNIAGTILDVAQVKVKFDADGKITSDIEDEIKTKKELGDDYGMLKSSSIKKEWFEQAKSFENWMVGKSVEEVMELPVKASDKDTEHPSIPDVPELTSSVTITVEGYQSVVKKAAENAK